MGRHRGLGLGLGAAAVAYIYVTPAILAASVLDGALAAVAGAGLFLAGVAAFAGRPRAAAVGAGVAALAVLPNLRIVASGPVTARFVAGLLEPLGLVLVAIPLVRRALAGSAPEPDAEGQEGGGSPRVLRLGLAVAGLSSLLYGASNLSAGNEAFLPANALAILGFGLAALRTRGPLFPR